ncbi:MAG: hypothetical protein H0V17_14795 [Deltaproteobacteria bacterium]|nr:hypothetical protein [Deltaproteobacteria bacterium]
MTTHTDPVPSCVVWLAWGDKYVLEAARSRESITDRSLRTCLITDRKSAAAAPKGTFDHIVEAEFELDSYLRKCELWRCLPAQYDSFLFLDVDTRVIGDISLGFDKAKKFGVAMAPAPRYALERFQGFDEIMRSAGVTPRGQIQFNSGVIFFSRTPGAQAVLEKWDELAHRFGSNPGRTHDLSMRFGDQPYLSLAMELLEFQPYVLSTAFNHRAKGELIDGDIRIWHSYKPIPHDINANPDVPYRYVADGRVRTMAQNHPLRKVVLRAMREPMDLARSWFKRAIK